MRTIVQIAAAVALSAAATLSTARPVTVGTSNVKCPAPWDPDPSHAWQARKDFLFSVWKAHNPDVMGLQEVVADYLPDIDAAFPGWDRISAGRDDGLVGGEACPLYWNRERFVLLESGTFWLSATPETPGSRFEGAHHPRICTFAFLKELLTGRVFCFYNTHTSYVSRKICAAQLEVIAADIRRRVPAGAAVVLTGDLNFELRSSALAPLAGAGLSDADEVCAAPLLGLWNSVTLYRNYPVSAPAEAVRSAAREKGGWEKAKKSFPDLGNRIDHIYVSDNLAVKSCGVDGSNRAGWYPSDHMPKFAAVAWKNESAPEFPRWTSVVAVHAGHEAECAEDVRRQLRETVIDGILVRFTLNPEGNPPESKAAGLTNGFAALLKLLPGDEKRCGALFQATMGHGWQSDRDLPPWQRLVLRDGHEPRIFCPLDPRFLAFMRDEAAAVAALRPAFFMVDDDTRLITGRDGCFCPLHLAEMEKLTGRTFTRETLIAALEEDGDILNAYDKLLKDSIVRLVRMIREEFDAVEPETPGAFCGCCSDVRHAEEMAKILAAKGQRPVVRLNNGRYCKETARDIPDWLHKTALQLAVLPDDVVVLAEPDTCPQNRYSMSAKDLDMHISMSILEGCSGGKLWISRCLNWEPASGEAYRRKLAERAMFYRRLLELRPRWEGVKIPVTSKPPVSVKTKTKVKNWGGAVFGRFGIPYANTQDSLPFAALTAEDAALLTDAEIGNLLEGVLLLDADGAKALKERGFTWDGGNVVVFDLPLPDRVHLGAPFQFYNEKRKREIISALRTRGFSAPYAPGDEELLVKWGVGARGERILAVLDTGHDDLDELVMVFPAGAPSFIERLKTDGSWEMVGVSAGKNGETVLKTQIRFLEVAVFRCREAKSAE